MTFSNQMLFTSWYILVECGSSSSVALHVLMSTIEQENVRQVISR
jgi:predicted naringenin-chalcone synthase